MNDLNKPVSLKKRMTALVITVFMLFTGCKPFEGLSGPERFSREFLRVEIINATETENGVFYKVIEFENNEVQEPKYPGISKEKRDYFISYVKKMAGNDYAKYEKGEWKLDQGKSEGHAYLGTVTVTYNANYADSKKTKSENIRKDVFDELPEGFEEFLSSVNEYDKEKAISFSDQPCKMSAEFYKRITGVTDEMVNDGTVEDYLKLYPTDVFSLLNEYADNYWNYYSKPERGVPVQFAYWPLYRAYPKTKRSEKSTKEELGQFAKKLGTVLGLNTEEFKVNEEGSVTLRIDDKMTVDLYMTCAIPDRYEYEDYPLVLISKMYLDGGEFIKDYRRAFFYSTDYKFAVCLNGAEKRSYYGEQYTPEQLYDFYMSCKELLAVG